MRIKLNQSQKPKVPSLWYDSPCSYNYITKSTNIDSKTQRFHIGSIYYHDEVHKQKKVFNEFEKPDLLLNEFRRQIEEASHPKYNTAAKKKKEMNDKEKNRAKSVSLGTSSHLYEVPPQTGYAYDSYGCRTPQISQYDVKQIESNVKERKRNFSFGRRLDLSRPLNFYPGPGTYDKSISLTERPLRLFHTYTLIPKKKSSFSNPLTDRQRYRSIQDK